jgi:hypothetical protein
MSEFNIATEQTILTNPQIVIAENHDGFTTFKGNPNVLRKIIWWIGDVVWPGWFFDEKGRKSYLDYAETCSKGLIQISEKNFLEIAWPKVAKHLDVDQIQIISIPSSIQEKGKIDA